MGDTMLCSGGAAHAVEGVTVTEQRENFLRDCRLNFYSISELAEQFSISRKTACKWINRYQHCGKAGHKEFPRKPHSCPWETPQQVVDELVSLRKVHPHWGPA